MIKEFLNENIRIAFFLIYGSHHAFLDPIYEILKKEFLCILSSEKDEIINFKPDVIIQADFHLSFRKSLPFTLLISLQHGFGTKNYSKRNIPKVDIVCLSSPWFEEECKKNGIHPRVTMWVTGFPPTDKIFSVSKKLPIEFGSDPTILYAPTYNKNLGSVDVIGFDWIDDLAKILPNLNLIIKPHPNMELKFPNWIKEWKEKSKNNPKVFLIEDSAENVFEYFNQSDLLLTDASSVMFFYLALDRPIILVNNPQRTNDEVYFDPDGAEWKWRDMGIEVTNTSELISAIGRSIKEPKLHSVQRDSYRKKVYGSLELGNASNNTATKISDFINNKLKKWQEIKLKEHQESELIKNSRIKRINRLIKKILGIKKSWNWDDE